MVDKYNPSWAWVTIVVAAWAGLTIGIVLAAR